MSLWTEIVNTALIGCERKSLSLNGATGELGDLLAQLDQNDREGSLLSAAVVVSLYERAATLPMKDEQPAPAACEVDDTPRCSERAANHLAILLRHEHKANMPEWIGKATVEGGLSYMGRKRLLSEWVAKPMTPWALPCMDRKKLLSEWLRKAMEAGLRAPEELLPELLKYGRKLLRNGYMQEPEDIFPVLGARGRWMAAQKPDWAYTSRPDETMLETQRIDQRVAFFRGLRKRDAARARELLASRWEKESPYDLAGFLSAFEWGLSLDDEAFLERALDDERNDVREVAARLLAHLPDSALCRRMFERARPLLKFKLDDLNRKAIEVTLLEKYDSAMWRDGVDEQRCDQEFDKRIWWLKQMLRSIPPKFWLQESGWTANELIEAAIRSEWKMALIEEWMIAAERSQDEEWADALLACCSDDDSLKVGRYYRYLEDLFDVLPQARQESLAIESLKTHLSLADWLSKYPSSYVYFCERPWGETLSRLMIDWLLPQMASWSGDHIPSANEYHAPYLLDPAVIPETIARISEATKPPGQRALMIEDFLNVIQARYEMFNAF